MVRNFDGGSALIERWLKNKDTVLFLGVWQQLNNRDFNTREFEGIKNEAGRNGVYLFAKKGRPRIGNTISHEHPHDVSAQAAQMVPIKETGHLNVPERVAPILRNYLSCASTGAMRSRYSQGASACSSAHTPKCPLRAFASAA